jgi:serine/threonine protein kinase
MMVLPGGHLKLIDFGLACPAGTEDFEFGGTLAYQAPELLDGDPASRLSDIYALGITAYELLTGVTPHPVDDTRRFFDLRKSAEVPDPGARVADLPRQLREFVLTACRRDPAGRYQDAEHALRALETMAEG